MVEDYGPENTYNADEIALFWLMTPDIILGTKLQAGSKKKKERITILPCVNATGTYKLDLWVLGYAKNPRAFGKDGRLINNLPVVWRNNKKVWMIGSIFMEFLYWFDR